MSTAAVLLFLTPSLAAAAPTADRTFDGVYCYRNHSKEELWVDSVTGLMACGWLVPDGTKGVHDQPFRCPSEVVIKWKVTGKKGWKTATVKIPNPQRGL